MKILCGLQGLDDTAPLEKTVPPEKLPIPASMVRRSKLEQKKKWAPKRPFQTMGSEN
jgi:hypothetical protein